ncbi:hypothetical protein BKA65DRAFT_598163 [Rhexocercosporidium sp. MPI-PUGE-AT-0058]|nr:hypothetical protein BKA65DRAFT_598163 [Rhexocercosporidium sp. MPI-PUGE-AT-0058]
MAGNTKGTCPLGGLWYTCTAQNPTFLGCCTSNTCQGDGKSCPASDFRAAGMGTGPGPDPGLTSNDASYWPNVQCSVGQWWTCAMQTPSFQGCCEVNPCGGDGTGCPSNLLHPAAFKSAPTDNVEASTVPSAASTVKPVTTTSSSAALVTSITASLISIAGKASETIFQASATASSTPEPVGGSVPEKSGSGLPIGAIAGGATGGIAVLIIGLLILCFCRKRRQKQSTKHINEHPDMIVYPGHSSMAKAHEGHQKTHNSEAYYPGPPISGVPNAGKYTSVRTSSPPVSPGPPPYQSGQPSPNPNLHEIDSSPTYGVQRPADAFGSENRTIQLVSHSGNSPGEMGDGIAELPHSPAAAESRWRSKRPTAMASVEIGEGNPRNTEISPGSEARPSNNDNRRMGRESYVSWQSLSP